MPREERTGKTLYCVACGALNYGFACFCIECGEPLDPDDASSSPAFSYAPKEPAPDSPPATLQRPAATSRAHSWARWETAAGLLILLLAIGYALYNWQRTNSETQAYRDGIGAAQRHEWEKAAHQFENAGDYRDAQER